MHGTVELIFTYMSSSLICPGLGFQNAINIHLYVLVWGRRSRPENSAICPGLCEFSGVVVAEAAKPHRNVYKFRARSARRFFCAKNTQIHFYVLLTYMSWFWNAAGTTHLYVLGHISEYLLYNMIWSCWKSAVLCAAAPRV